MRIRKYHPHQSVLFMTFSVEEGLLLLANPLCMSIVRSCLATAQSLYPVTICHFIVQATHVHMVVVVNSPDDVKDFVRHFKTESAHLINNLLGRDKRTIWCEGYDSPVVISPLKVKDKICYIYSNPVKDNLVESIDSFPGLSSWKMFKKQELEKTWKRLRRPAVKALTIHSLRVYTQESERLLKEATSSNTFRIEPNAWMPVFGITDPTEQEAMNRSIVERVKGEEELPREHSVIGREKLISRPIDPFYRPQRSGKRMCCLSEDRAQRVEFINFLKDLYARASEVLQRWRQGDFSVPFPPGLYPPSFPKLVEPLLAR